MIKKIIDLEPEEQKWLVKAIVSIILADGILEEGQVKFMKRIFRYYLEEEPKHTLIEISKLLKKKEMPDLEPLKVDNLNRLTFILDIVTSSVFANGKKLKSEVNQYFRVGKLLGIEVGTLSYRLSLEAEKERVKRKLSEVKQEIGEFLKID